MPRIAPPIAAIVDLDGTLVDTLPDFTAALSASHRELGLRELQAGEVEVLVGKGSEHLVRSALQAAGAAADRYDDAWQAYQRQYAACNGLHASVYRGADEGLRALRARGLRLACVTNKPERFARELLQAVRMLPHFDLVVGGDTHERKKPDPLPLLRTCEALGSDPARTLMIGDSSNDAAAARAAGCPVVLVTYGYNHGEPVRNVPADGYVDAIADVPAWIDAQAD
jgi:phosphoglycolate phosphatase